LTVLVGRPFEYMLDNVLEAATTAVQASGILLSIIPMVDENAIGDYTTEVPRPPSARIPRALQLRIPYAGYSFWAVRPWSGVRVVKPWMRVCLVTLRPGMI